MSDPPSRSDRTPQGSPSHPPTEARTPNRRVLSAFLALAEDRPLRPAELAAAQQLERDPELQDALARQRRLVAVLRTGGPAVPPTLAGRVAELRANAARPRPAPLAGARRPVTFLGAAAVAVAVIAAVSAAMFGWSSRSSSTRPTATQVAAIWTLPGTSRRVAPDPERPTQLDISFHGIAYPNYHDAEGWHPVAARHDRIGGLATATVFYETGRRRAAYTVVPVTGLAVPSRATRVRVGGLSLREFRSGDRWILTFERNGASCVLTAAAPRELRWLIALATWREGPANTSGRGATAE